MALWRETVLGKIFFKGDKAADTSAAEENHQCGCGEHGNKEHKAGECDGTGPHGPHRHGKEGHCCGGHGHDGEEHKSGECDGTGPHGPHRHGHDGCGCGHRH